MIIMHWILINKTTLDSGWLILYVFSMDLRLLLHYQCESLDRLHFPTNDHMNFMIEMRI